MNNLITVYFVLVQRWSLFCFIHFFFFLNTQHEGKKEQSNLPTVNTKGNEPQTESNEYNSK